MFNFKSHSNDFRITSYDSASSRSDSGELVKGNSFENNAHTSLIIKSSNDLNKRDYYKDKSPLKAKSVEKLEKLVATDYPDIAEMGVQTQVEEKKELETEYVKELKSQLESLKNEITRLHTAQTSLEKSLKQQSNTLLRPIIYNDYGGDMSGMKNKLNIFISKNFLNKI